MTNLQLYLTIGMPTLAVLVGILINGMQFNGQMGALSSRMISLEGRMRQLDSKMAALENKFDVRFDMLISKLMDVDNRLTRLETRFERH